jgi:hypothetical protein
MLKNNTLTLYLLCLALKVTAFTPADTTRKKDVWYSPLRIKKGLNSFYQHQRDSLHYPALVLHLGITTGYNNTIINLNEDRNPAKNIDFEKDLNFPSYSFGPRINIVLKVGHRGHFMAGLFAILRDEKHIISRDLYVRDHLIKNSTFVSSEFRFADLSLAYRYAFIRKKNFNVGFLAGLTALNYSLSVKTADFKARENVFFGMPATGLEGMLILADRFYIKTFLKFSSVHLRSYNFSLFNLKPQIEYYFSKQFGVGIRYHYAYTRIKDLEGLNFHGPFHYHLHAISLFGCMRFY